MKIDSRSEQSRSTMWLRTFGPSFLERSETWSTWRSCDGGNTYDNKPEDDDMELVQKMAEKHSSWIARPKKTIQTRTSSNYGRCFGSQSAYKLIREIVTRTSSQSDIDQVNKRKRSGNE
ncbi:MAG: hypothetical protein ALECFALPRED_005914 [Alectoria fallacina]|uniref:Uncharacterized protein n=1 Tax=Alectoria fallacina TaxID=1903189 RepID=A0A8H3IUM6_9LECA|nr:MAG: hypothetical protein ALECFALPRED_005914 [Alectoria fallacina]